MSRFHPMIAARVFNTPLLIHAGKLDAIAGALYRQWGVELRQEETGAYTTLQGERREPGYRIIDGVAVIDVFGVLAHRGGIAADSSYILGYQQIARRLEAAVADGQVHSVILDIDSPGGEVSGVFELAEQIRAASERKPIYAVADSLAASASYLIGSAATELSVSRTGHVGSIGVVWRHADFSRALEQDGIAVTHVYAGARKTAGNSFEPLAEDVRAEFQSEIDKLYEMFIGAVAEYRGIDAQKLRDTEARVYLGEDGVNIGLADRVETADELIARLTGTTSGAGSRQFAASNERGDITMSEEKQQKGGGEPKPAATATTDEALATARAEGERTGRETERVRVSAILTAEAAQGREELAQHLAFDTDMSAEQATAMLSKSPKAAATAPASRLDEAMARTEQPGIGPDSAAAETGEAEQRKSLAAEIAAGGAR